MSVVNTKVPFDSIKRNNLQEEEHSIVTCILNVILLEISLDRAYYKDSTGP